jgi:hypothetical protein
VGSKRLDGLIHTDSHHSSGEVEIGRDIGKVEQIIELAKGKGLILAIDSNARRYKHKSTGKNIGGIANNQRFTSDE